MTDLQPVRCRFCGKLADMHTVRWRGGVPVVGIPKGEYGGFSPCSERYADEQRTDERAQSLRTLARGLRWRAAWLSHRPHVERIDYLYRWADEADTRAMRLEIFLEEQVRNR
jgi:hypothetical protein